MLLISGSDEPADAPHVAVDSGASAMSRFEEASESSTASQAATLSLAGLEVLALQNNPTLFQAQAAVSAQQGTHRQAGLNPNPQVGYLNGSASNSAVRQSNGVFHYQVRNWLGWHHHQTLSLIAAWFLNEETRRGKKYRHPP